MNKDYLPFYNSLKDDDKEFWLNCSKEELIDHIVSNIKNGETLLSRIDKVKEYIRLNFCNRKDINDCWHSSMQDILDLLNGKEIEGD